MAVVVGGVAQFPHVIEDGAALGNGVVVAHSVWGDIDELGDVDELGSHSCSHSEMIHSSKNKCYHNAS